MNLDNLKKLRDQVASTPEEMFDMSAYHTCIAGIAVRHNNHCTPIDSAYSMRQMHVYWNGQPILWRTALSRILECDETIAEMIMYGDGGNKQWLHTWTVADACEYLDDLIAGKLLTIP